MMNLFKNLVDTSAFLKLNWVDVVKLLRNGGIVGVGAFLAYLAANVGHLDLGAATAILVPLFSMGVDAVYKLFKDNVKVEE